jgi:hypothetical protein
MPNLRSSGALRAVLVDPQHAEAATGEQRNLDNVAVDCRFVGLQRRAAGIDAIILSRKPLTLGELSSAGFDLVNLSMIAIILRFARNAGLCGLAI